MKKYFLTLCLMLSGFLFIQAQTDLSEAFVEYTMDSISSSDPQVNAMMSAMKGGTINIFFKGNKMRTDADMMGGVMKMSTFMDFDQKDLPVSLYWEIMGQKIKVNMSEEQMNKMQGADEGETNSPDIIYNETIKKKILDYNCYQAIIKMPEENEGEIICYITEEVSAPRSVIQNRSDMKMKGFPMQYVIVTPEINMQYTVSKLETSVSDDVFKPLVGYRVMDVDQFMGSFGAMQGLGQ